MAGEELRLLQFHSTFVEEAALPGTEDAGGDEGGDAASHVDHAASGKVDHANAEEGVGILGAQEARVGPNSMDDDGIDKARQHHRVAEIRSHLATLGQRTSDDRGRRRGEGELEQPEHVVVYAHEEEVGVPNERGLPAFEGSAVGEGIANGIEAEGGAACIQEILEHGVLDILLLDGTGTKHGESGLHEEDERGGVDEEEGVEAGGEAVLLSLAGLGQTQHKLLEVGGLLITTFHLGGGVASRLETLGVHIRTASHPGLLGRLLVLFRTRCRCFDAISASLSINKSGVAQTADNPFQQRPQTATKTTGGQIRAAVCAERTQELPSDLLR